MADVADPNVVNDDHHLDQQAAQEAGTYILAN